MNKSVSVSRAITVEILHRRKHAPHGLHGLHATVCVFRRRLPWLHGCARNPLIRFEMDFQQMDSGFILERDSGFQKLDSGFQCPLFRVPRAKISRIPESGLPYMGKAFDATNQNEISMLTFYFNIKVSMIWPVHIVLQHDNHLMMVCWPDGTPFKLPCGNFKSRNRS